MLRRIRNIARTSSVAVLLTIGLQVGSSTPVLGTGSLLHVSPASPPANKLNLFDPRANSSGTNQPQAAASDAQPQATATPAVAPTPQPITHNPPKLMSDVTVGLDPVSGAHFLGSDGRLELSIPGGAVTTGDVASAGGGLSLLVRQIDPASGGNAGGSGHYSFGTFLLQVVDVRGQLASQGLHTAILLRLHFDRRENALDLAHAYLTLNTGLPAGINLNPDKNGAQLSPSSAGLGAASVVHAPLDSASNTLTASPTLVTPTTSASFGTNVAVATFGKPDIFNADLNVGAVASNIPLDLPGGSGAASLLPHLGLNYNSAGVNEQHNPQGAAGWVGEGWALSMGSITWSEHNVAGSTGTNWEDTWQLNDAFGLAAQLIPPNTSVTTYYDDTPNQITPSPIFWRTVPESHIRIYSFVGPVTPWGMTTAAPCFRLYLQSGVMEEFGCTSDSLQYYPSYNSQVGRYEQYVSAWNLDLITDRHGNQVHVGYYQDWASAHGLSYPRDEVPQFIQWDSPNCRNGDTACSPSSSWQPLLEVSTNVSSSVAYPDPAAPSCPAQAGNLRCDDPTDFPGGLGAPEIQNTYVLNDIYVQARTNGTPGTPFNTLRHYKLSYYQTPKAQFVDPVTGSTGYTAGRLTLSSVTEVGTDDQTQMPVRTFTYGFGLNYYEDSSRRPAAAAGCGPTWNTSCLLWSMTYAGNSYYMISASNGLGLAQNFYWAWARNNTHDGGSWTNLNGAFRNAFNCSAAQSTYPCNQADDQSWSRIVIYQQTDAVLNAASVAVTGTTTYGYYDTQLTAHACNDCNWSFTWGNRNDADWLDYYNGTFVGFQVVWVTHPDSSTDFHIYSTTEGWGIRDSSVTCYSAPCFVAPWWDATNALHGHETEADYSLQSGGTPLKQSFTRYALTCPPAGTGSSTQIVSELDPSNPIAVCDVQVSSVETKTYDHAPAATAVPDRTTSYTYDPYGRVASRTDSVNDGTPATPGTPGSPPSATTVIQRTSYVWNDSVTATPNGVTGVFLIDPVAFQAVEDGSGNRYACEYRSYDGIAYATGPTPSMTLGNLTRTDRYETCGTSPSYTPGGQQISVTHTYDAWANLLTTDDADANAGTASHRGCTVSGSTTQHSQCYAYDSTYEFLVTSDTRGFTGTSALTLSTTTGYSLTTGGGYGLWPTSTTDPNNKTTTFAYDPLGRETSETLPDESAGLSTLSLAYTVWCSGTAAQAPCAEVDRTQRLDGATTVTSRGFYDGWGHLVETRTPAPAGQDVLGYSSYDQSRRLLFQSITYFGTAYVGAPGSAAFATPDGNQPGTTYGYDGLGREVSRKDALSNTTTTSFGVACSLGISPPLQPDATCYEQILSIDPLGHEVGSAVDAFGRTSYALRFTGNSPTTYAFYAGASYTYDPNGNLTQILQPDGRSARQFSYDAVSRKTSMRDPDTGTTRLTYDNNGNVTQSVDARGGTAGTVVTGYDGLDRPITKGSTTATYATFAYDSTVGGNIGIGRLTGETFSGAPYNSLSGSYSYTYDSRGRQTGSALTIGSATYPMTTSFDDAGNMLGQTYPTGEIVSYGRTLGWLTSMTSQQGTTVTPLLSTGSYTGPGGAAGLLTGGMLGTGGRESAYSYGATYDALLRATDLRVYHGDPFTGLTIYFDQARTFDAAGNVTTANTTLTTGTDNQAFCYDEQNRLTWAGSAGTPACGVTLTRGTLTAAQYTQSFAYDKLGNLTSGPLGAYTYGDSRHLHAATSIGSTYSASYDLAGNQTCRAPSASLSCAGTPTGAQLTFDVEGRLASWQSSPTSPTTTAAFLYDNQGNRVAQQVTTNGTTTTTTYVGDREQISTTGTTTTTTTYYYANGMRIGLAVNGVFSFIASDGLGSATMALANGTATATASTLFTPYGSARYANGTMPTDYGFTGQHGDAATGLDYYNARYFDPLAGQFASADSILPGDGYDLFGLSRYAYVEGNPVNRTDPTGQLVNPVVEPAWTPVLVPAGELGGGAAAVAGGGCVIAEPCGLIVAGGLVLAGVGVVVLVVLNAPPDPPHKAQSHYCGRCPASFYTPGREGFDPMGQYPWSPKIRNTEPYLSKGEPDRALDSIPGITAGGGDSFDGNGPNEFQRWTHRYIKYGIVGVVGGSLIGAAVYAAQHRSDSNLTETSKPPEAQDMVDAIRGAR